MQIKHAIIGNVKKEKRRTTQMIKLQPIKKKQTILRSPYLFILASLVCLVGSLFYFQPGVGYEIVSNGEHVGYVKTKAQAEQTVESFNRQIRDEKGEAALQSKFPAPTSSRTLTSGASCAKPSKGESKSKSSSPEQR